MQKQKRTFKRKVIKHGMSAHPLYSTWKTMMARCYNPNNKSYNRYGGSGVIVCERWRKSPAAFFEDMGEKPSPAHSLDRIGGGKVYSKESCRWATKIEQVKNRTFKNPKSKFLGVGRISPSAFSRGPGGRPWTARISSKTERNKCGSQKQINLGVFRTEIEAAIAYDKAAIKIYGTGAELNFPEKRAEYEAELAASSKS